METRLKNICSALKPLTVLPIGNEAAKVKTTLLVSKSDFMITFQKKVNIAGA